MTELSEDATEQALYCVNELITRRNSAGVPLEPWMPDLAKLFDVASLTCGMSATGHESDSGSGDSGDSGSESEPETLHSDLVGSREAADLLVLSPRQVRRIASQLGADKVGGRRVYSRARVIEYAEEQRNGRTRRSIRTTPQVAQRCGMGDAVAAGPDPEAAPTIPAVAE